MPRASSPTSSSFPRILSLTNPRTGPIITEKIADEPLQAVVTCLAEDFDNLYVGMEMRRVLDARPAPHDAG